MNDIRNPDMADAREDLLNDVRAAIRTDGPDASDKIIDLIFERLTSARPPYFTEVLDRWGEELSVRNVKDPATFRLLFNAVLGQSPINGRLFLPIFPSKEPEE